MASLRAVMSLMTGGYRSGINRVIRDTDRATNRIMRASIATDDFNRRLDATGASVDRASSATDDLSRRFDDTSASVERTSIAADNLSRRLDATGASVERTSIAANSLSRRLDVTGVSAYRTSIAAESLSRRLVVTGASTDRTSIAATDLSRRLVVTGGSADRTSSAAENLSRRLDDTSASADRASSAAENLSRKLNDTSASADRASSAAESFSRKLNDTSASADRVSGATENLSRWLDDTSASVNRARIAAESLRRWLDDTSASVDRTSSATESLRRSVDVTGVSVDRTSSAADDLSRTLYDTSASADRASIAAESLGSRYEATSASADRASSATENLSRRIDDTSASADRASGAMNNLNRRINDTGRSADQSSNWVKKFTRRVMTIATAIKGIKIVDEYTNTAARLKLLCSSLEEQEELQNKIFAAANRSRGSYNEMANAVAKMGLLAKDAFTSHDELIAFTELVQKAFRISGADPSEQAGAMRQLTQAMASGRLQGDELVSVMENAPMIFEAIAKYIGVSKGELRELASEGVITADIIKNAMFDAAGDIDKAFNELPMTFGDAWIAIQNNLLETFQPLIQTIAKGAQLIADNWSNIEPIFWGLAAAVGAYATATWMAKIANEALIITMLKNPITWIAIGIGLIIALIYKWVQSVGGLKIAWMIAMDVILTAWDVLKIGFFFGVYAVMDLFNKLQICFKKVSVNIANFMGDMKANVLMLLQSLVNGAIDIINKFIGVLNKIPGVSIDTISHVTFGTNAQLENEAAKQARNEELEKYITDKEASMAERDQKLLQMIFDAEAAHAERQLEISKAQAEAKAKAEKGAGLDIPEFTPFDPGTIEGTGNGGKLKVEMSDEDLKYLRDIAERDYINKFTTATLAPNIQISFGDVHETADANKIAGRIRKILQEEIAMAAEGVYD